MSNAKESWIEWSDQCPNCGDTVQVLTSCDQDMPVPQAYDGDKAKCVSCKWEGSINVDSDDEGMGRAYLDDGNLEEIDEV